MTIGGNTNGLDDDTQWDFFVSYTQVDRPWAEWISWVLEEAGYRILVQAWDFTPGSNWIVGMHNGIRRAARTIAVLSEAYTRSVYGQAEWQAAWTADPDGARRKLLVFRVENCPRPGLLGQVVSIDLFGLPAPDAHAILRSAARLAVTGDRAKPTTAPPFPLGGTARRDPHDIPDLPA